MPATSIDTFFACSIMIILALSAMAGTSMLMSPYLENLSHRDDIERYQTLGLQFLLNTGQPSDWGRTGNTPLIFGLAKNGASNPYELDADKLSRLNNLNAFSLKYSNIWTILGVKDVAFQIAIQPIFTVNATIVSNRINGTNVDYEFEATTNKEGQPIPSYLVGYLMVDDFITNTKGLAPDGRGNLFFEVPESYIGSAIIILFAQSTADSKIVSSNGFNFDLHNRSLSFNEPTSELSPLNHTLFCNLSKDADILEAKAVNLAGNFSLNFISKMDQSWEYSIPSIINSGPMALAITGNNGSSSFAEFVMYPQIPIKIGPNFDESVTGSKVSSENYVVCCNGALYEVVVRWSGIA